MTWLAYLPALAPLALACWLHGYRLGVTRKAQALWEPADQRERLKELGIGRSWTADRGYSPASPTPGPVTPRGSSVFVAAEPEPPDPDEWWRE